VLAAALAAGIPLPHSCRAGRCATCKAHLVSGEIAYPGGVLPPGIVASEAARGEVLLCQARPRSDLRIRARVVSGTADLAAAIHAELERIDALPLAALRVRVRIVGGEFPARPGQFVDLGHPSGYFERLPVIRADAGSLDLEAGNDGSVFREWLDSAPAPGSMLELRGPFDRLR